MRLVCPNCVAQYEVDESAIPASGRDVQCAACNHTWFQDAVQMLPTEDVPFQRRELDPEVRDILRSEAEFAQANLNPEATEPDVKEPDVQPETPKEPEKSVEKVEEPAAPVDPKPAEPAPDDLASRIKQLEEEFEAEVAEQPAAKSKEPAKVSADEKEPLAAPTADEPKKRKAYREPNEDELIATTKVEEKPLARRDRLPEVEDIEEDLEYPAEPPQEHVDTPKQGFSVGFWAIIVCALILLLAYIFAQQIIAFVPQLDGILTTYSGVVDRLRILVEEAYGNIVASIFPPEA